MISVRDGSRTLQFNGTLLGSASSQRHDSTRWIEFELYRTENGSYVLSRIGVSVVYHGAACHLVKRYSLVDTPVDSSHHGLVPCELCKPSLSAGIIFPEKNRYWAQVSDDANAVLEALYQYDASGARYLTNVAQRLLEAASSADKHIESVYKVELIP